MKSHGFSPFLFGLFTALFAVAAPFAAADVIHVKNGISIAAGTTGVLNWDVDSDGIVEFSISYDPFAAGSRVVNDPDNPIAPLNAGALIARDADAGAQSGEFIAANLPSGFLISETLPGDLVFRQDILPLTTTIDPLFGLSGFQINIPGYIGFSFPRTGSSTTLYGWARLTVVPGTNIDGDPVVPGLTISEWAYETTGGSLSVPVPEPSITAFLALGTCGLVFRKRQSIRGLAGFQRTTNAPGGDGHGDSQPQHFRSC